MPALVHLNDIAMAGPMVPPRPLWTPHEDEVVANARRLHASWDAIGAMLGRPTPDVRKRYDPSFGAFDGPPARPEPNAVPAPPKLNKASVRTSPLNASPDDAPLRMKRGLRLHRVLDLASGQRDVREIAAILGLTPSNVANAFTSLKAMGFVDAPAERRACWVSTRAGRRELARLAS